MNRIPSRLALGLMAGLIAHAASAAAPTATVNGTAIPAARAEAIVNEQRAQGAPDTPELREAVREELIRREVLAQAAVKKGIDKREATRAEMELARQGALIRAYVQDYLKTNPVTDAELRKEYEGIKGEMGDKEYKPRHILVETEGEAKAIVAKLQKGEKFADLASQSIDPGSRESGGDLGWSSPGMYVKPFGDALLKLEKGQYTVSPVKSEFGYHVIQLDDVREMQAPAFEEVKPQLAQRMQQQKVEQHIMDLRNKAKVQ